MLKFWVRKLVVFLFLLQIGFEGQSQQLGKWIWFPGDFDIALANKMQNRRTERGTFFPPFWRMDHHEVLVDFHKVFDLKTPDTILIYTSGKFHVKLNSKMLPGAPQKLVIPAGKQKLSVKIYRQDELPALLIKGRQVFTDESWWVTNEDKEWIDESGKVSEQSGTTWMKPGFWHLNDPLQPPHLYRLPVRPIAAVSSKMVSEHKPKMQNAVGVQEVHPFQLKDSAVGKLFDFGRETIGFLKIHGLSGKGTLHIFYGESEWEARSPYHTETLDLIHLASSTGALADGKPKLDTVLESSKALRYAWLVPDPGVDFDSVTLLYEYLPVEKKGYFECSDTLLNKIWNVSAYTMELTTREFFIDGIKRDRWIWSGDAYQSYLMNYYLYGDAHSVTRTLWANRGKDPVNSHINTIMDYSFYWFMGIYDYYLFTGDLRFLEQIYPRMKSLMDFCLGRLSSSGYMEGLPGDWVFIDWAKGLSKKGAVSVEQILWARSLETMSLCAALTKRNDEAQQYRALFDRLKSRILSDYWLPEKGALAHSFLEGKPTQQVTRYANMFATFFQYLNPSQRSGILDSVLFNKNVPPITTPYMRFYELEAMCNLGAYDRVLQEIRTYWGGMLAAGASSFWEEFDPELKGNDQLAMYGRPFGKSLCHAWGASPLYLLGRYYLGVKPTAPGFEQWEARPVLGDLSFVKGAVPTPTGSIALFVSKKTIEVQSSTGVGTVYFSSKKKPSCKSGKIESLGGSQYKLVVQPGQSYTVDYQYP